jgi:putative membrane-bound dehydrogenase-like protein
MRSLLCAAALLAASLVSSSFLRADAAPPVSPQTLGAKAGPKSAAGLTPAEAAAAMTLPEGFRVSLFAGEPDVQQPVAMAFDARGRLWVVEAYTYPQRAPGDFKAGKDRIVIFEDTGHTGHADKRTVFMEGLNLASAIEVGHGGVFVGAAPYFLFIPVREGDDKPAGDPVVLLDGFAYNDTHEVLNGFNWGPDGWLYGTQGVFSPCNVGPPGTPADKRVPLNCGVWRYHPVTQKFEVFAWGTSNPWGVDFDDRGQAFISACVIPHLYHMIQGGRYQRQGGSHFDPYVFDDIKTIADHAHYAGNVGDHAWWGRDKPVQSNDTDAAGGGHAHAGVMLYLGDNFPDAFRNQIFMNNIHGNRVNIDVPVRAGSGFVGKHGRDFLFANDQWFRGINLRYGPDGAVYDIDWYDKSACHRGDPQVFDRTNGRIYKVTYGSAKPIADVDLTKMTDAQLVQLQLHKNDWYVRTARRVLAERAENKKLAADTGDKLAALLKNPDATRRLRGLWAMHATGTLGESLRAAAMNDPDEYVRAWAIQLECEGGKPSGAAMKKFAEMAAGDPSLVVRLYLASALQKLPVDARWPIAAALLAHGEDNADHNLPLMDWYAAEPLVMSDVPRAMKLAEASKMPLVSGFIRRRAGFEPAGRDAVVALLKASTDPAAQVPLLRGLEEALAQQPRVPMPQGWPEISKTLAASSNREVAELTESLAARFGDAIVFPSLRKTLADAAVDGPRRLRAMAVLVQGRDAELPPILQKLLDEPPMRGAALAALGSFDHVATPGTVLAHYADLTAAEKQQAIAVLSARASYAAPLLDAVESGRVSSSEVPVAVVRQLKSLNDAKLTARIDKLWVMRGIASDKAQQIAALKKEFSLDALRKADPSAGRVTFGQTCGACHTLYGQGGKIGPDLTGSNRGNLDYLLENVVDPSAVVGKDYQLTVLTMKDGRVLAGMIRKESPDALTVQTLTDQQIIARADLAKSETLAQSMMPEGLLAAMTPQQRLDLVSYLASTSQVPLPGDGPRIDGQTGRVAGAFEGEAMKVLKVSEGGAAPQNMSSYGDSRWSGDTQLWWTGAKPGAMIEFELPVPAAGRYEVFAVLTKARDYGIVQAGIDEKKLGEPIDGFAGAVINTGPLSLGIVDLKAGTHRFTLTITGANPRADKAYMVGLDYVSLRPAK